MLTVTASCDSQHAGWRQTLPLIKRDALISRSGRMSPIHFGTSTANDASCDSFCKILIETCSTKLSGSSNPHVRIEPKAQFWRRFRYKRGFTLHIKMRAMRGGYPQTRSRPSHAMVPRHPVLDTQQRCKSNLADVEMQKLCRSADPSEPNRSLSRDGTTSSRPSSDGLPEPWH